MGRALVLYRHLSYNIVNLPKPPLRRLGRPHPFGAGPKRRPICRKKRTVISKELLEILVCPDDHTPLTLADDELVARLNQRVGAGQLTNKAGEKVERKLDGGLLRADGAAIYPIIDGIPILLIDEAILLNAGDA